MPTTLTEDSTAARELICKIGKRLYARNFVSANEGNLSIRLTPDVVICTPTLICKGDLEPSDLCAVDLSGKLVRDPAFDHSKFARKPTSEILLHLEIYRQRADITSVVHSHPPHATAFAITRQPIPTGVLPEPDLFLGTVPMTEYETPGSQKFADTIVPYVKQTNVIVLANHGTVSYANDLERAFWLTEILDSYCRTLILAKSLGDVVCLTEDQQRALRDLRSAWGLAVEPKP